MKYVATFAVLSLVFSVSVFSESHFSPGLLNELSIQELSLVRGGECKKGYECVNNGSCVTAGVHGCGSSGDGCTTGTCANYCTYTTGTYSGCDKSELSAAECDTNACAVANNCTGSKKTMVATDNCAGGCSCSFAQGSDCV